MEFNKIFTNIISKLNLYVIPQFLWLMILYYLMINVFYNYYLFILKELNIHNKGYLPNEVIELNTKIMYEIKIWLPFILFLGIALLLSGLLIALIKYLPIIKNYEFSYHGDFGLFVGGWLILICLTIKLYQWFDGYFIIIFLIISMLLIFIDYRKNTSKSKSV
jgi:hypothetical protein